MLRHQQATKAQDLKKDFLDTTELIRSIQRAEGNPDCFGRAQGGYCDQVDCAWRAYCLGKPQQIVNGGRTDEDEQCQGNPFSGPFTTDTIRSA